MYFSGQTILFIEHSTYNLFYCIDIFLHEEQKVSVTSQDWVVSLWEDCASMTLQTWENWKLHIITVVTFSMKTIKTGVIQSYFLVY